MVTLATKKIAVCKKHYPKKSAHVKSSAENFRACKNENQNFSRMGKGVNKNYATRRTLKKFFSRMMKA